MIKRGFSVALVASLALPALVQGGSDIGSDAPALEPVEWLNHKGPISWKALKGRLILVEKWATW